MAAIALTPLGGGVYTIAGTSVGSPSPTHIYPISDPDVVLFAPNVYTISDDTGVTVVYPIRVTGTTSTLITVTGSTG